MKDKWKDFSWCYQFLFQIKQQEPNNTLLIRFRPYKTTGKLSFSCDYIFEAITKIIEPTIKINKLSHKGCWSFKNNLIALDKASSETSLTEKNSIVVDIDFSKSIDFSKELTQPIIGYAMLNTLIDKLIEIKLVYYVK